jgi:hypothetical protein
MTTTKYWKQDEQIHLLGNRRRVRKEVSNRLNLPLDNLVLIACMSELCATIDGSEDKHAAFKEHLNQIYDWMVELEMSLKLSRRNKRAKQPGTVAGEVTEANSRKQPVNQSQRAIAITKKLGV